MQKYSDSIHLRSITVKGLGNWPDAFPYNIPIITSLAELVFTAQVTFLVGENGCSKSTFLEAIACAAGSITVGSESVKTDKSLAPVRALARDFRLAWSKKKEPRLLHARRGFFWLCQKDDEYARGAAS